MGTKHDKLLIILTVLVLIFSFVAFFGVGIYIATTDEHGGLDSILRKYETKFSPPTWAYSIWFLIGLWQITWVVYVMTTICRYTDIGPLYRHPPVISKLFMWAILISLIINCVAFLFLINDWFLMFIIFMLVLWFALAMAMVYLHVRLDEYWVLLGLKFRHELTYYVIFAQNGVSFYAIWVCMTCMSSICSAGVYLAGTSQTVSTCLMLTLFLVLMVSYFFLDMTLWDRYIRYTFTVYPVILWTLLSILIDQWTPWNGSNVYTLFVFLTAIALFVAKIIVVIVKRNKSWGLGELTCLVLLLQNGIAFYASGAAIFSAGAICSGGAYIGQLSETSATSLAVAIFFVLLVGYFVLDVTLWDRYLRFTFSVYPMIVWILLVVTTSNWEPWSTSNGLTLVLLIIVFIMFIVKAIVVIVRQRKGWSLYVEGQLLPL